jgi:hypothetical protein
MDGPSREIERSFWEKRHRRQSREGSGERARKLVSFMWAGAHESISIRATGEPRPVMHAGIKSLRPLHLYLTCWYEFEMSVATRFFLALSGIGTKTRTEHLRCLNPLIGYVFLDVRNPYA